MSFLHWPIEMISITCFCLPISSPEQVKNTYNKLIYVLYWIFISVTLCASRLLLWNNRKHWSSTTLGRKTTTEYSLFDICLAHFQSRVIIHECSLPNIIDGHTIDAWNRLRNQTGSEWVGLHTYSWICLNENSTLMSGSNIHCFYYSIRLTDAFVLQKPVSFLKKKCWYGFGLNFQHRLEMIQGTTD